MGSDRRAIEFKRRAVAVRGWSGGEPEKKGKEKKTTTTKKMIGEKIGWPGL